MHVELLQRVEGTHELSFRVSNIHLSFANALRRTIQTDIPVVGMYTEMYKHNQAIFHKNTTRFHNEILKHRLSCIPIHWNVLQTPSEDMALFLQSLRVVYNSSSSGGSSSSSEADKRATTSSTKRWVCVKDLRLEKEDGSGGGGSLCPEHHVHGNILVVPLRHADQTATNQPEELIFECNMSICSGRTSAAYTSVCQCLCTPTFDKEAAEKEWKRREHELLQQGSADDSTDSTAALPTESEVFLLKNDYFCVDAYRHVVPHCYDFKIQSIGVYDPVNIVSYALFFLREKCRYLKDVCLFANNGEDDEENNTTHHPFYRRFRIDIEPSKEVPGTKVSPIFDVRFYHEDHTLGNIFRHLLFAKFIEEGGGGGGEEEGGGGEDGRPNVSLTKPLSFVAFNQLNPTDSFSVLRIGVLPANFPLAVADEQLHQPIPFIKWALTQCLDDMMATFDGLSKRIAEKMNPLLHFEDKREFVLHSVFYPRD